ncbi:cytochrome c [Flaviaesturariibacter flavus]|uniref:Cytochrome c n=1 Tax=Flaviaesturariibacter flavus TaxID=2502780 RepID=A0A4R1BJS8_9BACT|nr:cytochrome c [Flaviaesturariibacter flavus]TCJ17665.1 cytochrome c [Flaviaesturariibacter flavus]
MKKVLRYLLIIICTIITLVGAAAAFIAIRGVPKQKAGQISLKVEATPQRLARGEQLASLLCKSCHLDPNTNKFTGKHLVDVPQFGDIYSKNITRHTEFGIGRWTDGELAYLLRTGIKPDGTFLPLMVKLKESSDEDIYSIIAFLRSNHSWVQPDNTRQPDTKYSMLTKFLTNTGILIKPVLYPKALVPQPDTANAAAWGRYIMIQLDCWMCHSKDFLKLDPDVPEKSLGFFGGGNLMKTPDGKDIYTRNLTMDEETGIGRWTEEEFIKAVRFGIVPNGEGLREPMPKFTNLSDREARAIYAYLKTVPKIKNQVSR